MADLTLKQYSIRESHTHIDPVNGRGVRDTVLCTPILEALGFFAHSIHSIASFVTGLFFPCGPFTVGFTVRSMVFYSLDSIVRWRSSHVEIESIKRQPLIANRYSSAPIIAISRVILVVASFLNGLPAMVSSCSGHTMFRMGINGETAARYSYAVSYVFTSCFDLITTGTTELPKSAAASIGDLLNASKSAKLLSSQINKFCHNNPSLLFKRLHSGTIAWI